MDAVRSLALSVLNRCESANQYSNIALDTAIKRADLSPSDRAFLTTLVYGVIERRLTLDAIIESLSAHGTRSLSLQVRNLLRMGLYQMAYLDRIPDHAAVNETVALAPRAHKGFVNAILRAFGRTDKAIPTPDPKTDPIEYLSVKYSVGALLCERFVKEFGFVRTESILFSMSYVPPVSVRVNTLKISREELMGRWEQEGIACRITPKSPVCIQILDKTSVTALSGFGEGLFFVQDEASQLAVKALDAKKGMRVLDACSCPGSKAFGAAIDMENQGTLIACDLHENKLSLVTSGAERLGISILKPMEHDARECVPEWVTAFDRVLCDVPCSGFGVLAKKPELRYKDPAESERLPKIQRDILETASSYVRVGGRLVYSTCTVLSDENEEVVHSFLASHSHFALSSACTLYPDTDGTDGFFFAVLERRT